MSRNGIVLDYLSADEVKMRMSMTGGILQAQKWLVVYNALVDPRPVPEIAMHTGLSEASVVRILSEYNQHGPTALNSTEGSRRRPS